MYDLLIYCLKVGACLVVFYLFFKLLLSRETFHRLNRIVVLGAMVLAFVLPLCVITVYRELPVLPEVTEESGMPAFAVVEPQPEPFPWNTVAGVAFLLGAAVTLATTLWSLAGVLRLIRSGRRERLDSGTILVRTDRPVTPFSWGRYIVLSEKDMADSGNEIILHERAHLRLHHSWDLLATDIAGCLQWFNPAMWLLRRELRAIHEYEADEAVLDSGIDAKRYQLLLIKKAAGGRWYSVANSFNHSKLKNRITMMLCEKSSRWAGAKALLVVPLAGLALGAFAETAYVFPDDKGKKENVTVSVSGQDISVEGLKGKVVRVIDSGKATYADSLMTSKMVSVTVTHAAAAENGTAQGMEGKTLEMNGKVVDVFGVRDADHVTTSVVVTAADKKVSLPNDSTRVIRIRGSKGALKDDGKVVWIIDGRETKASEMDGLKPENIGSISVYKDATVQKMYPGRDIEGVIEVHTKQYEKAVKAGKKGIEAGKQALEAARSVMDSKEYREAKQALDEAVQELNEVRDETQRTLQETAKSKAEVVVLSQKYTSSKDKALVYIDGRMSSPAELKAFDPAQIHSFSMLRGEPAVKQYGPEASDGVIVVTTKKSAKADAKKGVGFVTGLGVARVTHLKDDQKGRASVYKGRFTLNEYPEGMLVYINGKKSTRADVERLEPKSIKRMEVYKSESAVKKYGEEGSKGAIEITTNR